MNGKKRSLFDGDETIHAAVRAGDVAKVGLLLRDVSPNRQNRLGEAPLHVACQASEPVARLAILRLLWEAGARVNAKGGPRRQTALHLAVKSLQIDAVRFLLVSGANPNARDKDERTALHLVAGAASGPRYEGCAEAIVEMLLERGANLHAQDARWRTPLVEAICCGNVVVARALLKAGVQVDYRNRLGLTALFYACETQRAEMAALLLDHGASVSARDQRQRSAPLHFVAGSGRSYTHADDSTNRSHELARLLVARGADVDALDAGLATALHVAVDTKDERLVETLLLEAGARLDLKDEYGNTALHVLLLTAQDNCCNEPRLERIARLLVERGASINEPNDNLETPFHFALWRGNPRIVAHLLVHGADLGALWHARKGSLQFLHETPACNTPEICGDGVEEAFAPLNVAASLGHLEVVNLLLDRGGAGADLEMSNFTGSHDVAKTPLYFAVKNGRYEVAKLLLDAGCKVNRSVLHNTTVLHVAVSQGNAALTHLLLEYGADAEVEDAYGRTALSCAVEYSRESLERIAKILVMHRVMREFRCLARESGADLVVMRSRKWLEDFRMDCVAEVLRMREERLCDNLTTYAIASRRLESLTACLGNAGVVEAFVTEDIEGKYPIYRDMLRIHFDLALERRELLDCAAVSLNALFKGVMEKLGYDTLPDVIVQKILDYCPVRELGKIKAAGPRKFGGN